MFFKNSVCRYALFCGEFKKIYRTHNTNKICFVQYSAIRCCASFSHSKNGQKQHSQNTSKKSQINTRKTPQNTFFKKHSQNTAKHRKTPAKHPQNTAKRHHKTHLLTKQTKLANKPLRSPYIIYIHIHTSYIYIER